jgi:outer membrane protein OmpA-like peptidoglycan-associated protein
MARSTVLALAVVLVAASVATGCGGDGEGSQGAGETTAAAPASSLETAPPSQVVTSPDPDGGGPPASELTTSGGAQESAVETRAREILRGLRAERRGGKTVVTLPEDVLFDFDRADIKPSAAATLDRLAEAVRVYDDRGVIRITGFTDSKGSTAYNLDLSRRRADAVLAYLVARGARADRLRAAGRGEADPVAPNAIAGRDNPAGRRLNRRVEIVIPGV